jgi:hypothetical protein
MHFQGRNGHGEKSTNPEDLELGRLKPAASTVGSKPNAFHTRSIQVAARACSISLGTLIGIR